MSLLAILAVVLNIAVPGGRAEAGAGDGASGVGNVSGVDKVGNVDGVNNVGNVGGVGGTNDGTIWSLAWWSGTPLGPGPDIGGPGGGVGLCVWMDLGRSLGSVDSALFDSGLPPDFFDQTADGGHPGIWGVNEWGRTQLSRATSIDHFDLVACPHPSQVPPNGGDIESDLPEANPPGVGPRWLWLFWDAVPDLPGPTLPPVNQSSYAAAHLPVPRVETSPSTLDGIASATVVNFPTWLWIDGSIWHEYIARAIVHGLVATVWARPVAVEWRAGWSFPVASADPEGGVTFAPERLNEICRGPGTPYRLDLPAALQSTTCSFVFTQSTFGTRQALSASVEWEVHWAVSDRNGVVGGEGDLGIVASTGIRWLRVLQVESVISQG